MRGAAMLGHNCRSLLAMLYLALGSVEAEE